MIYRLQFFSRPSDEGETPNTAEFGYDGSMTVTDFKESNIQQYLARMDCIFGECLVIVSYTNLERIYQKAFRTTRTAD